MIVTIDGPAGAGKSSIAKIAADRLGFEFLDTGALYRAMTLAAIRAQVDFSDTQEIIRFSSTVDIQWDGQRVLLKGEDVSEQIRTPPVTDAIRFVADLPEIRSRLSEIQRQVSTGRNMVTEGRDQGSEVFSDAECKIFLTASPEERARRRHQQLADMGRPVPLDEILRAQDRRDEEDRSREIGALRPADDASIIESDGMTTEDVLELILKIVRSKIDEQS
ncbi:MAG: (d)CMP kinase [Planctomycetota bacterium]|nr:(d)CMP kinase [Planctomycetota bacterium]